MPFHSFQFARQLHRYELAGDPWGPRFHRWLPDGEVDAIRLTTDEEAATLRVWFNRFGRMEHGFIRFALNERNFDPAVIPRQAVLDAGPLYGQIDIELDDKDVDALRNQSGGAEPVAKRLLRLIQQPVARLIRTLRT